MDKNEITKKSNSISKDNIPPWLAVIMIVGPIALVIWQPLLGSISLVILGILWFLFFLLYSLIKNIKYRSFNKLFTGIIVYIISAMIVLLSLNFLADYFGTDNAGIIAFYLMLLLIIPAYLIPNKIYSLIYNKKRIYKEFRFKVQNFIRPNRKKNKDKDYYNNIYNEDYYTDYDNVKDSDSDNDNVVLANKNCIVNLMENVYSYIICYDKKLKTAYHTRIENHADCVKIFAMLAKFFNFDTKISDVLDILKGTNEDIKIKEINDNLGAEHFEKMSINNMSVAELIELPGINMGKAYKINKYLQDNEFTDYDEFTDFAQISEKDAKEIQEIFNHDIRYIPKK